MKKLTRIQFLKALRIAIQRGDELTRLALLDFFDKPENIVYFGYLFTEHITKDTPEFHEQVYSLFTQRTGHKAVAAPRGFAKSTITDVVVLTWYILTGRKHFAILVSDTYTQAALLLEPLRNEIENNVFLQWLYPNAQGDLWSNGDFIVRGWDIKKNEQTVCRIMAKGAGMKVRGLKFLNFRPDLVIIDDLENDELVESDDRRKKLMNWFKRSLLPALAKKGEVLYIGTILHFDALLIKVINKKDDFAGWHTLRFKALKDDGTSLWPEHFTAEELVRMRDDPTYEKYIGPLAFAQEMQNEPIDDGQRIIKPEWLDVRFKYAEEVEKWNAEQGEVEEKQTWTQHTFKKIIGAVDPAISESNKADYFAMVTIGIRHDGHIFILDYIVVREGDIDKQVDIIIDNYLLWHHDAIRIESVSYQKGLYNLVKKKGAERQVYPPIHAITPDKDKTRRAVIHSANFAGGLVHLRQDHPKFNDFYNQIIEFPLSAHDDIFDAYMHAAEETIITPKARAHYSKAEGW